jgi:3-hydroxybutyryl-CoA dehydrogenase
MRSVGVVGAGVIGQGVALTFAMTGHDVVLLDLNETILERAIAQIRRDMRGYRLMRPELFPANARAATEAIRCVSNYANLADVEFVVENVIEDLQVKEDVYRTLDQVCGTDVCFAANTSVISVTRLASCTTRPDRILGIHFMNPVPLKQTAEVIRGVHTSDATLSLALDLLNAIGKQAVVVADSPGFVANRVLMLAVNEAAHLVYENVASAEDVDRVFVQCFDHKMGMLETADLIGLDTVLRSIVGLYEQFRDSKYRPCPLLVQMVDAGFLGRKSGRGFYRYDER